MKVAFIGLGEMGQRMCRRLLKAGNTVTVYNRTAAKTVALLAEGAQAAETLREACRHADVAISMVRDDEASASIWTEELLSEIARTNTSLTVVDMSTLSRTGTRELAARMAKHRITFVAAPVIGSLAPAEAGKLLILAGSARALSPQLQELLHVLGERIVSCPTPEAAAVLKLAVNYYFALQVKGLVDALQIVRDEGVVSLADALELFKALPIVAPPLAGIIGLIATGNYAANFPIELVAKDLRYLRELGSEGGRTSAVSAVFEGAETAGLGGENIHAIWKL